MLLGCCLFERSVSALLVQKGNLLFTDSNSQTPVSSLRSLLFSLLALLPEESSPRVIVVKPDLPAPTPVRPNGTKPRQSSPPYDPSILFILEFAATLALRDAETVDALGKDVAGALEGVIRDAAHVHTIVVSRAVYYLLRLLRASNVGLRASGLEQSS